MESEKKNSYDSYQNTKILLSYRGNLTRWPQEGIGPPPFPSQHLANPQTCQGPASSHLTVNDREKKLGIEPNSCLPVILRLPDNCCMDLLRPWFLGSFFIITNLNFLTYQYITFAPFLRWSTETLRQCQLFFSKCYKYSVISSCLQIDLH